MKRGKFNYPELIGFLMEKTEELEERIETPEGRADDMDKDAIIKDLQRQVRVLKAKVEETS